jgi:hypothetical protein
MRQTEAFLASVLPRLTEADNALHNGDAGPRKAMWSHSDPVTLFGAARSGSGWDEQPAGMPTSRHSSSASAASRRRSAPRVRSQRKADVQDGRFRLPDGANVEEVGRRRSPVD